MEQAVLEKFSLQRVDAHAGELLAGLVFGDLHGGGLAHAELLIVLLAEGGQQRGGVRVRLLQIELAGLPAELQLDRLFLSRAEGGEAEKGEEETETHRAGYRRRAAFATRVSPVHFWRLEGSRQNPLKKRSGSWHASR
jgi:hypothetical protein